MLVLSRKSEESLLIGDNITITILGIEGDRVKIGIDAPPEVVILRREVRDRALREGRSPGARPPARPSPEGGTGGGHTLAPGRASA